MDLKKNSGRRNYSTASRNQNATNSSTPGSSNISGHEIKDTKGRNKKDKIENENTSTSDSTNLENITSYESTNDVEREDNQKVKQTRGRKTNEETYQSSPNEETNPSTVDKNNLPNSKVTLQFLNENLSNEIDSISDGGKNSKSVLTPPPSPATSLIDKDLELTKRLDYAKFRKTNSNTTKIFKEIIENIKDFVTAKTKSKFEIVSTGSYYDKTQVLQAIEFDVLLCHSSRSIKVSYHPSNGIPNVSLCCLSTSYNDVSNFLGSRKDKQGRPCLTPRKFYSELKGRIEEFVQEQKIYLKKLKVHVELELVPVEDGCPAVTLRAKMKNSSFTVDIVPAFKIIDWPKPAADWTCNWIEPEIIECYKWKSQTAPENRKYSDYKNNYAYAVPKIHHSERNVSPDECMCFQISFGQIEKNILKFCIPASRGCMKNVYKLLKQDLQEFYGDDKKVICSFHIKHLIFDLMNEIDPSLHDQLRTCYLRVLEKLIEVISDKMLPMFFLPEVNLLEMKFQGSENMEILNYFHNKYREYNGRPK